jgi:NAD(P)-dependent dehydrogenase (short-subunit alcohol dehydrogenase family)
MSAFLENKSAVVTGGTRGIGRAIAKALAEAGAQVAICGRQPEPTAAAASEIQNETGARVVGQAADVSRLEDVRAFFQFVDREFGGLDILVNNAGIGIFGSVAELEPADWERTIGTNLSGVYYCSREALHRFGNRGGGSIINMSSLAGKNAFAGGAAYNASKFGLTGFSEALMQDHRHQNVKVSYVMPGSVATEFGGGEAGASWKIAPQDVAEVVLAILHMPERTLISRVEMRPSRPSK